MTVIVLDCPWKITSYIDHVWFFLNRCGKCMCVGRYVLFLCVIFEFAVCIFLDVFSLLSVRFLCNHVTCTTLHEVINDFINLL